MKVNRLSEDTSLERTRTDLMTPGIQICFSELRFSQFFTYPIFPKLRVCEIDTRKHWVRELFTFLDVSVPSILRRKAVVAQSS